MTKPLDWLMAEQGLSALQPEEIDAIRDFTLLWGIFESEAMATDGSQAKVVAAVNRMPLPNPLPQRLTAALAFWRARYWEARSTTNLFAALNFQANTYRTLVTDVLSGARVEHPDIMKALLLIILRLRNNLFHGVKWQHLLRDQLGNFTHANQVLISAIDWARPPGQP